MGGNLYHTDTRKFFFVMTLKNFVFPKGSFGFGQKVLQEFLTKEPKKIMLLGPGTDSLAKSVAAYAGIPEVGLLQVCRTQRFVAHWRCEVCHGICLLLQSSILELVFWKSYLFPPGFDREEEIQYFNILLCHAIILVLIPFGSTLFLFLFLLNLTK